MAWHGMESLKVNNGVWHGMESLKVKKNDAKILLSGCTKLHLTCTNTLPRAPKLNGLRKWRKSKLESVQAKYLRETREIEEEAKEWGTKMSSKGWGKKKCQQA